MSLAYSAKVGLIRIAKFFPFLLCAIVGISYIDCLRALLAEDYMSYLNCVVLNTPINWFVAKCFEYGVYAVAIAVILAFALETCVWNKLAIAYLGLNLLEKSFFTNHEFDNEVYYIAAIANILICGFFCYKGIKQLLR